MADALDFVLQMRREKQARVKAGNDAIQEGISGGIDNFFRAKEGDRQQQTLNMRQREAQINELLATAKIQQAQTNAQNSALQSKLLNSFLTGNTDDSGKPVLTSATIGGVTISNPQAKAKEAATIAAAKPLSGETARMLSGAKQGLSNIKDIQDVFKFSEADGKVTSKDFSSKRSSLQRQRVLESAGVGKPGSIPQILSLSFADDIASLTGMSTEEGRILALKFATLAENILRARTGAQAPEQEQVREETRTLLSGLDSPASALERLREAERFLKETAKQIRPGEKLPVSGISGSKQISQMSDEELRKIAGI